jgi:hypothetical protein
MNKEFFVMLLASVFIRVYPWFIFLFRITRILDTDDSSWQKNTRIGIKLDALY